jgi:hypothetical protein
VINNTFFIVCREADMKSPNHGHPNRDRWGWEFADNIERMDWQTAKKDLQEYQAAMPNHIVRIRCVPIDKNRHDYSPDLRPQE